MTSVSGRFAPLNETLINVPLRTNPSDGSTIPDRLALARWWSHQGKDSTLAHAARGGVGKGIEAPTVGVGVHWAGTAHATISAEAAGLDFIRSRLVGSERYFEPYLAATFQGETPRFSEAWQALCAFIDPSPEASTDALGRDLASKEETERLRRRHPQLYALHDPSAVLRFQDWSGQVRSMGPNSPWRDKLDLLEGECRAHDRLHDAASQARILEQDKRHVMSGGVDDEFLRAFQSHPGVRSLPWLEDHSVQTKFLAARTWRDVAEVLPDEDSDADDDGTQFSQGARSIFLDAHRVWRNNQDMRDTLARCVDGGTGNGDVPGPTVFAYNSSTGGLLEKRSPADSRGSANPPGVDPATAGVPATTFRGSAPRGSNRPVSTHNGGHRQTLKDEMPRHGCPVFWAVPGGHCPDGAKPRIDEDGRVFGEFCGKLHGKPHERGSVRFKTKAERASRPIRRHNASSRPGRDRMGRQPSRLHASSTRPRRTNDRSSGQAPDREQQRGPVKCFHCGGLGHIKIRCPELAGDMRTVRAIRTLKNEQEREDQLANIASTIGRAQDKSTRRATDPANKFAFGTFMFGLALISVFVEGACGTQIASSTQSLPPNRTIFLVPCVQEICENTHHQEGLTKSFPHLGYVVAEGMAAVAMTTVAIAVWFLYTMTQPHTQILLTAHITKLFSKNPKETTQNLNTSRVCMIRLSQTRAVRGLYRDSITRSPDRALKRSRHGEVVQACFDSGATGNVCTEQRLFSHIRYFETPKSVTDAGGHCHSMIGVGDVALVCTAIDGSEHLVKLEDVALAPTLTEGLYVDSTRLREKHGWNCIGNRAGIVWKDPNGISYQLTVRDGLEFLDGRPAGSLHKAQVLAIGQGGKVSKAFTDKLVSMSTDEIESWAAADQSLNRWQVHRMAIRLASAGRLLLTKDRSAILTVHHQLAGCGWRVLAKYAKKHALPLTQVENLWATTIGASKQRRKKRGKRKEIIKGDKVRPRWSVDVVGKLPLSKHRGRTHMLVWVESGSRTIQVRPLSHLRDIPLAIAEWADGVRSERAVHASVAAGADLVIGESIFLHGDGASYFLSANAKATYRKHLITWTNSPPHQQYKNAHAERAIQTIMQHTKALLYGAELHAQYWPEAAQFAAQVYDHLPCMANEGSQTPYEIRTGRKSPDVTRKFLPFGAKATVHVPKDQREHKLSKIARPATVMGWSAQTNAPIIEVTTRTGRSALRVSNELSLDPLLPASVYRVPGTKLPEPTHKDSRAGTTRAINPLHDVPPTIRTDGSTEDAYAPWVLAEDSDSSEEEEEVIPMAGEVEVFQDHYVVHKLMHEAIDMVRYSIGQQIKAYPHMKAEIEKGTLDEVNGLVRRCLEPVSEAEVGNDHVSTLTSMWTVKRGVTGQITRQKCRNVFPGQHERIGQEYWQSRSDVPKVTSIRVHLALSPFPDEETRVFDVGQAYTLAKLEEDLPINERRYIQFNKQISPIDPTTGRPQLYRVVRGIYGMKAAGRQWQLLFFGWMKEMGFSQSTFDPAIFYFKKDATDDRRIRAAIWVDDVVARGTPTAMAWFRAAIVERFVDIKEGPLNWVLGMKVTTGLNGYLAISSSPWIKRLAEQENIPNSKHRVPLPSSLRLTKADRVPVCDPAVKAAYLRVVGQLGYLSNWTTPYLAYPVSMLASVAAAPSAGHLKIARSCLSFVCSRPDLGLQYKDPTGTPNPAGDEGFRNVIEMYTDSGWAQEDDYVSQSGFLAWMNGSAVSWGSKRQPFPALSSTEAEIIGGCDALRVTLTLKSFLEEIGFKQGLIRMYFDATNAIRFNVEEIIRPRSHHIGVRYHRCRHEVGKNITVEFVRSENELADLCTKNTTAEIFDRLVGRIMSTLRDASADNPKDEHKSSDPRDRTEP